MLTTDSARQALIFDSGIGGLSISDEIRRQLPELQLTYVADNRNYPYGALPEAHLSERILKLFPELIARFSPDLIIVACNSASTLVLDNLRELTPIPVIGVVPAIKTAAEQSISGVIGLLATVGTVQRAYTSNLISTFASHCQVIQAGSQELVEEAEKKLRGEAVNMALIEQIVAPFRDVPELDQLVLGCTHFPFLNAELTALLGDQLTLVDSSNAIARRASFLLANHQSRGNPHHRQENCFVFTRQEPRAQALVSRIQQHGYAGFEFIDR